MLGLALALAAGSSIIELPRLDCGGWDCWNAIVWIFSDNGSEGESCPTVVPRLCVLSDGVRGRL